MKWPAALLVIGAVFLAPLPSAAYGSSLLERAEAAAASGSFRAQNAAGVTTGLILPDDKKRSAIAFGISGLGAFLGAALWRYIPCRNASQNDNVAGLTIEGYNKCWDDDGNRQPWDTPTKALVGAGVALELVSLGYLIAHLRSQNNP